MTENKTQKLTPRPPVVVVVGHIDHGKTLLLDYIRKSNVIEKESGGITQHIGAYEVAVSRKDGGEAKITFLDTPGHEAFSKIRSRGAGAADIAVLVVAADEGVKPQTEESIKAIKEADIPFVVAISKIDKENASPDKVKTELAEKQIFVEGWGGQVPCVGVSAKTGHGIDELLETILLLADLEELSGDPDAAASGVIIESSLDHKRGNMATILIMNGTLCSGEFVLAENALSPVRIFEDFLGHTLKQATFSSPVRVIGFNKLPNVGAKFSSFRSKKEAETTLAANTALLAGSASKAKTAEVKSEVGAPAKTVVPIIIKADVFGSLEALENEVRKFDSDRVAIKILKAGTGMIGEEDLKLAMSTKDVIILAFRSGVEKSVREPLNKIGIPLKEFDIIYEAADWLKDEIQKRMPKETRRTEIGKVKILKIFNKIGQKQVVGGRVLEGLVAGDARFQILRNDHPIGEGKIVGLEQAKMKIKEVEQGNECGLLIASDVTVAPGDIFISYKEEVVQVAM